MTVLYDGLELMSVAEVAQERRRLRDAGFSAFGCCEHGRRSIVVANTRGDVLTRVWTPGEVAAFLATGTHI